MLVRNMATHIPANVFSKLKLDDPELALLCVPSEYVDCTRSITRLSDADLRGGASQLMSLKVTGKALAVGRDKRPILAAAGHICETLEELQELHGGIWKNIGRLQVELVDDAGMTAQLSSFQPFAWRSIATGRMLHFIGSVKRFGDALFVSSELEPPGEAIGGVWTRYLGIPGQVSAETVSAAVHAVRYREAAYLKASRAVVSAMQMDEMAVLDLVQYDQADQAPEVPRFPTVRELVTALHLPRSVAAGARALELAQRISAASIRTAARAQSIRHPHRDAPLIVPDEQVLALAAAQPEQLSGDQHAAILAIAKGLRSPVPMNGLLSGDVGTGKTLAFLLPAVVAHQNGATVAIVAPTIILANQIAGQIARRFSGVIRGVERVEAGKRIQNPGHILVGTSGLPAACAKAHLVPNFVIIDEQHKLSVQTRAALVGPATHVLEATATPVPRSLATVFFDGLEVFSLRESPVVRTITSHVLDVRDRGRVTKAIRETIAVGRRVLVVYPRVETVELTKKVKPAAKGEQLDITDSAPASVSRTAQGVIEAAATFEAAFPGKVAVLHGDLSDTVLQDSIDQVRSLEKPLAVASVVVETGIDIPDIGLVVVRDADRLGLSQLHQLRGRLARNGGAAEFFMMVESIEALEDPALERLVACSLTTDGYRLAEIDMKQRGFGSYLDGSQSGNAQGVFRLTKVAPADFLGMANATVDASREEEVERADIREAEALLRRVHKAVAAMRENRVAREERTGSPEHVPSGRTHGGGPAAVLGAPPGSARAVSAPVRAGIGFGRAAVPARASVAPGAAKPVQGVIRGFPAPPAQAPAKLRPAVSVPMAGLRFAIPPARPEPVPAAAPRLPSGVIPGFPPRRNRT
ncbi:DEAD/DEAH box helicase [uncultured Variovorax sp.]|uniref:DEAD/DEAH box helicase n=1 Tax=uncultured Variovorax sp. TaxID=114708 RepID=UPI0026054C8B|nr:DEAD/DEAH box helicase [uncultured Variovorax sp.]